MAVRNTYLELRVSEADHISFSLGVLGTTRGKFVFFPQDGANSGDLRVQCEEFFSDISLSTFPQDASAKKILDEYCFAVAKSDRKNPVEAILLGRSLEERFSSLIQELSSHKDFGKEQLTKVCKSHSGLVEY